jgi:hypothetical protein
VARTKNHIQIYSLVGSSAKHQQTTCVYWYSHSQRGCPEYNARGDIIISGAAYIINRLNGVMCMARRNPSLYLWILFLCFVERLELIWAIEIETPNVNTFLLFFRCQVAFTNLVWACIIFVSNANAHICRVNRITIYVIYLLAQLNFLWSLTEGSESEDLYFNLGHGYL